MIQVGGTGGNTEVNAGTNGVHRYSMPIDTSILKPGTLNITVTQMIGDPAKGTYQAGDRQSDRLLHAERHLPCKCHTSNT